MKPLFKRIYRSEYGMIEVPTWNPFIKPSIMEWSKLQRKLTPIELKGVGDIIHVSLKRGFNI